MLATVCRNCGGSMQGKRSNAVFCKRACKESYSAKRKRGAVPQEVPKIVSMPAAPMGVVQAVVKGDELEQLRQMRLKIAEAIDECRRPADLPPLTKRLQELSAEIAALENEQNSSVRKKAPDAENTPRPFKLKAI